MKIGLLTPGWPGTNTPNGIATSVRCLSAGLRAIGQAPVILGTQDGPLPQGMAFACVPPLNWRLTDRVQARLGAQARVHRRLQADCIVQAIHRACDLHGLDAVIMEETRGWACHVARKVLVPIIVNLHGPWALLSQSLGHATDQDRIALEADAFEHAAGLMAPSQAALRVTDGIAVDTPRAIIRNSFPPGAPVDTSKRRAGHVLFVGRVERLKGADTVLLAFEQLARQSPDARLTFVGPDRGLSLDDGTIVSMEAAMAALAPTAQDRITYLGSQTPDQIARLRQSHPIALIASRFENLNYSMLEAISASQAVVSTNVGGPAEILTDGVTASLVPPGDPEAMATALARLISTPDHQGTLAANALEMLTKEFHPEAVARQTVAFCRSVLAHGSHP